MPKRAAIELLPEDARKKINQLLIEQNFSDYDLLTQKINLILQDYELVSSVTFSGIDLPIDAIRSLDKWAEENLGVDFNDVLLKLNSILGLFGIEASFTRSVEKINLSRSSVHRYGKDFQQKCEALRFSTEQARAIVESSPDDEGQFNEALQRLIQERLFNAAMELDGDVEPKTLAVIARAAADISRASISTKKYAAEVRAKAESVAQEVTQLATKGGLSDDAAAVIRAKVLGIAA